MDGTCDWNTQHFQEALHRGQPPAASLEKPLEQSHAEAVRDIAVELRMPVEKVEAGLAALEAQPRVMRGPLLRPIAEAWLEGQRRTWGLIPNRIMRWAAQAPAHIDD